MTLLRYGKLLELLAVQAERLEAIWGPRLTEAVARREESGALKDARIAALESEVAWLRARFDAQAATPVAQPEEGPRAATVEVPRAARPSRDLEAMLRSEMRGRRARPK